MLSVSTSLFLILPINSSLRGFLVHYNNAYVPLWKNRKLTPFAFYAVTSFSEVMTLHASAAEISWPWPPATTSLKKTPKCHDPFMHKIWDREEQKKTGEDRSLTEVQQECLQNPQNVFVNWLIHMVCFIILINRRLQSQSLSLTELCFLLLFLKANQFKKSTTTKEETYKVMLSQKISNTQNCETFRNFKRSVEVPNTAVPEIYVPKWTTRTEGLEKNILTWHLNAPSLWKQWN